MKAIPIFVGYDPREAVVYHTCVNSIIRHASQPVAIVPLALNLLQDYKENHTDGSNQFIYSRFLVPYLMRFNGIAIFIDGDMIVKDDIVKLYNLVQTSLFWDVAVVKHDYETKMSEKYLGAINENYPRKNWSSVIVWNCGSYPNRKLSPEFVEKASGAELHRFTWIDDSRILELPAEWNWLPDEYGANADAKLLHYTLGAPCFHDFATTPMADEWHKEHMLADYCKQRQ